MHMVSYKCSKELQINIKGEIVMERKAKVGDKVRVVSVHPESIGEYEIGDTFVVVSTYNGDDDIYVRDEEGHTYCLLDEEYEVLEDTVQTLKDQIKPFTIAKLSDGKIGIFLPNNKEKLVLYNSEYDYITSLDSFDDNLKGIYPIERNIVAIKNSVFPINALYNIYKCNEEIGWDWKRKSERTEEEKKILGIALQLGLKYVTRDADGRLTFWEKEPVVLEDYDFWCIDEGVEATILSMSRGDIFKEVTFDAGVVSLEELAE